MPSNLQDTDKYVGVTWLQGAIVGGTILAGVGVGIPICNIAMKDTIEKRAAIVSDWKNNKIPNILSKTEHRSQVLKDVPRIVAGRVNFTLISPDGYEQVSCDTKGNECRFVGRKIEKNILAK